MPTRASPGPERARLTHPAPRVRGSLRDTRPTPYAGGALKLRQRRYSPEFRGDGLSRTRPRCRRRVTTPALSVSAGWVHISALATVRTALEFLCIRHRSLRRVLNPTPPFPPRGPSGRFPRFRGNMKALRLPAAHLASLRFLRSAIPRSLAETAGPPRFLGSPCACAPCSSTPVGPRRQASCGAEMLPTLN